MEKCNIQGAGIDLPIDLIENPEIFSHVLSLDTWKHVLTPENRSHLKNYLPILPTENPHAQEENLRALFDEKNFKFGNPLQTFRRKLQAGYYASDIVKYRRQCKTAKLKEYKLKLKKFYRKLVNDVLISRQEIIEQVLSSSHSDMPISLSWHERQMQRNSCLTGNLDNKYKKILKEVKDECEDNGISSDEEPSDLYPQPHFPFNGTIHSETCYLTGDFMTSSPMVTPTSSQQSVTEEDFQRMLQSHKRKRMNREAYPELDTQTISLEDVISRTNVTGKKVSKTVVKKKIKGKDKKEHIRKLKKRRSSVVPPVVVEQPPSPVVPVVKDEQVEPEKVPDTVEEVKSLKSLEISSPCFFCLLRDIFLDLPDTTADLDQLERMVGEWQLSSSCAASPWSFKEPGWIELIPSALKFLAGSSAASSSPSFLPLVIFKQKVHQWKWIGTYRDTDSDLVPLCEQWFETKDQVVNNVQAPTACTAPGISLRTDYVVGPSTNDEKSDYQNQERDRYENPHKPFIYRMHGFDSIVAPVKGVFTKESNLNKAREHSLLVSKRPPYVTILTLVRDAAARLPNGEGTRAEVCQLLKDSQYINPDATDGQIHTVVSGALDRLHYEKDPCVKYDNARKVWIYLHKTRSVEEFEKIHEASAAAARAKKQMSQKQKLIKQQQKAKETALLATHLSPSSSTVEGGDGISTIIAAASVVLPENVAMPKPKKPSKPKRPAASPKKSDKSKGKVKKESLELVGPSVTGTDHPPQLMATVLPSFPPVHIKQEPPSLDYLEHQEQGLFHSPTSSAFARTSRLNSPYMVMAQPDNTLPSYNVKLESGYGKPTVGNGSSSSSSSSESESESDSSSGEDVITGHGSIIPERQDPSLRYRDPRVPFNNMSLFQGNPNGSESENTFGGY